MQTEPANTPQELNPETAQPEEPQAEPKKEKEPASLKMEIMSWIVTLVAAIVIATLVRVFIFEPIRVDGTSMTNTLKDGEVVYASKLAYRFGDVEYNDIVICRYPNRVGKSYSLGASMDVQMHTLFVKRIVALPGDKVSIQNGKLYVNGEEQPDPEFMASVPRDMDEIKLGRDEYFAVGDNRLTSHDSRSADVGPLSRDQIMGKVTHVLWPLNAIRAVE